MSNIKALADPVYVNLYRVIYYDRCIIIAQFPYSACQVNRRKRFLEKNLSRLLDSLDDNHVMRLA